jgi:hypothetical protein
MNEKLKQKIACTRENTVLNGEIDFNVNMRLDFPSFEKLKYAFTVEELIETVQEALEDAMACLANNDSKLSRYVVNWTEVEPASLETKGLLEAVLESWGSEE